MIDWFLSGGIIMWPLLALALGVITSAVRAGITLRSTATHSLVSVLFWGAVAFLMGALGTVAGLVIMARRIALAGGASNGLVWGGVGVALISLAFGILVFLLSGFLWLALDVWGRRIATRSDCLASIVLLVALSSFATGCGEADSGRFVVSDSAGIRVAANPGADRPFPARPVRVASLQPPDSALTAMPWGVVADPETGRIFVADGTSGRVVAFEADGSFARVMGRAGDGPGEFRQPMALALDEVGVLAVWDARRGVISRWSAEGELLNERQAPLSYWGPGFAIRGDGVVAVTQSTTGDKQRQSLVESTGAGDPNELFAVTRELVQMELPGVAMPAPRIFAPDLIWTAAGDTVLVLHGPEYRIDAYAAGRPVASIRRDIEPIAVTSELAAARVGSGPYRGFMRRAGITADQMVAAVGYEALASPIEWLATDRFGRLWVSRGSGLPLPDRVDVFAPDGRYLGTFDAPGFPVAFPSDSQFVALEITELGEPVLGLYRLESAEGRAAVSLPPDAALGVGDEFRDCAECPTMVVLPPGRFLMGSPAGEAVDELQERWHHLLIDEKPQVAVEVAYPMAVGKYEVTFAEWDRCVEVGGCSHDPDDEGFGRGDRPVLHVNRLQAEEYLRWLSEETGHVYRLPSEAEWEYAARGGTITARHWGEEIGQGMANCDGCGGRWNGKSTAPVGSFPANGFGLHDMLGNAMEWVSDCYYRGNDAGPNNGGPVLEASPYWEGGTCTVHVRRGGAWRDEPWEVRAAHRTPINTRGPWGLAGDASAGFRVLRALKP